MNSCVPMCSAGLEVRVTDRFPLASVSTTLVPTECCAFHSFDVIASVWRPPFQYPETRRRRRIDAIGPPAKAMDARAVGRDRRPLAKAARRGRRRRRARQGLPRDLWALGERAVGEAAKVVTAMGKPPTLPSGGQC